MADGAVRERWDRTATLWAPLANWCRDEKARPRPFTPFDVHPYHRKPAAKGPPEPKMPVAEFAKLVFG